LARALPEGGKLLSLELDEEYARIARANIERAGLSGKVEVRVGDARELLSDMQETFDLVFIDADKEGYPAYLDHALRLTRSGSLILADNTIFGGSVIEGSEYADAEGKEGRYLREFNDRAASDERLSATIIPLLRERVDGMTVCRVR
ncbi:MAG: class I SAM-dependent methyltransferase, partial [Rubrobacter sp.]|nr:class I SAM-dependent methyltransferase [Rubrobacter sp.]